MEDFALMLCYMDNYLTRYMSKIQCQWIMP